MIEVGLWIQTDQGESLLIKKDPNGYPDVVSLSPSLTLTDSQSKKEAIKALYEKLTGKSYAHAHATTRQVLWDFLEVAIQHLP
ncbi:MAG: hypothetical protein HY282_13815 [Nitrospirae bacterium]|nr:hypothetical protein [Candidatus Manganitrophaceae bacterium]